MAACGSLSTNKPGENSGATPSTVQLLTGNARFVVVNTVFVPFAAPVKANWNAPPGSFTGLSKVMGPATEPYSSALESQTLAL